MEESFEFDLRQSSLKVAQEQDRQKKWGNPILQLYETGGRPRSIPSSVGDGQ